MTGALWAAAAMVVYMLVSFRVGDRFPFSRYSMYASVRQRTEGAVFSVRVGGVETPVARLDRFVGIDPDALSPRGFPCSQEWVVWEVRRWVGDHLADRADADAVAVELGFRLVRLQDGRLEERFVPLAAGRAHWRAR